MAHFPLWNRELRDRKPRGQVYPHPCDGTGVITAAGPDAGAPGPGEGQGVNTVGGRRLTPASALFSSARPAVDKFNHRLVTDRPDDDTYGTATVGRIPDTRQPGGVTVYALWLRRLPHPAETRETVEKPEAGAESLVDEKYFTPKEIADKYKVTRVAVLKWINEGRLKAIRLGKVWRIPESALEEFIRQGTGEKGKI